MRDDEPFAFAGLWERWEGIGGKVIESCTILTTEANEVLAPVHDRMPVIVASEDYDLWLDTQMTEKNSTDSALASLPVNRDDFSSGRLSVTVRSSIVQS
jgi:putative SOS response-associated peptidase YedK